MIIFVLILSAFLIPLGLARFGKKCAAAGLCGALMLTLAACSFPGVQYQPLPTTAAELAETSAPAAEVKEILPAPPTPVVETALKGASLLSERALNDMDFLVVIQTLEKLPEGSADRLTVTVNTKPYRCAILEQFTNRLYCVGEPPQADNEAEVRAFAADPEKPVFEGKFTPEKKAAPVQPSPVKVDLPLDGSPTPAATEGPTGGGGDQTGSGVENIQPGGSVGGGMEEMGGGIAPTAAPGAQNATPLPTGTP